MKLSGRVGWAMLGSHEMIREHICCQGSSVCVFVFVGGESFSEMKIKTQRLQPAASQTDRLTARQTAR